MDGGSGDGQVTPTSSAGGSLGCLGGGGPTPIWAIPTREATAPIRSGEGIDGSHGELATMVQQHLIPTVNRHPIPITRMQGKEL